MQKRKLYGLFCYNSSGTLLGLVENSFSMSWRSDRVCVFSLSSAEYYLKKDFGVPIFLVRLNKRNKSVPIKVFIKEWADNRKPPYGKKFYRRNIRFELVKQESQNERPASSAVSQES